MDTQDEDSGAVYPAHLVTHHRLATGTAITVRPIRPGDDEMVRAFLGGISRESGRNRLLSARRLTEEEIRHLSHIDYDREMAFIAVACLERTETEIGVVRYVVDEDGAGAEFALLITDAWQGRGVGVLLLGIAIDHARARGIPRLHGVTNSTNAGMLRLAERLGFEIQAVPEDASIREVVKVL
jgi:acetyltransferase